jgi:hypothetical protein
MTRPGWPSCCGTSRPRCSAGYAATGSCTSPPRHGAAFRLAGTQPWPVPAVTTVTETTRYGTARAAAWGRLYQQLAARAGWDGFDGELPIVEGTLIQLQIQHLPGDRSPDRCAALVIPRRHLRRSGGPRLAGVPPPVRYRARVPVLQAGPRLDPAEAPRPGRRRPWTWILLACYAQLHLARRLAADIRLPWQRPSPPGRPATRHDVGKTAKRDDPKKETRRQNGYITS